MKDEAPMAYPHVLDPTRVGSYPALAKAGGGFVWDEVLEYRVWCRTPHAIPDFLSPNAPDNRLDILRGVAKR